MNVPPVDGWSATSPRAVLNVERSSWAKYCWVWLEFLVWVWMEKEGFGYGGLVIDVEDGEYWGS